MTRQAVPAPEAPAVGDAVVLNGDKLRIRELVAGHAVCRASFGLPGRPTHYPLLDQLTWDPIAGVWRHRRSYQ